MKHVVRPKNSLIKEVTSIMGTVPVCKTTIQDISKEFEQKPGITINYVEMRLADPIKEFAYLFANNTGTSILPASRGYLDHEINLKQEEVKQLTPHWAHVYNTSRKELLILRMTLTDLLPKG